jgi:DNA (cytosine-5)-methyltransferase 3A
MACGMLAMQKAGIEVTEYYAYEIDKYAIQTATHNFPMIKECGDVFKADFSQYDNIDFLIGGSPCTYWSIAQKSNRETTASGLGWDLFSQYVRALHEAKPKFFIYENNKSMSAAIKDSITLAFGFEPICINSALVSAQNRQRLYWVGKRNKYGSYYKVDVKQPEDRGILLRDVLDWQPANETAKCKSQTIKSQYVHTDVNNIVKYKSTYGASGVAEPVRVGAMPRPNGELSTSQAMRVYSADGKSVNITAGGGGMGGKTGLYALVPQYAEPCKWNENGIPTKAISYADSKVYTVYEIKDGLITILDKEYPIKLKDGYYIIRKLTVAECKRLQTVPDWYKFPVSNTQAYKMLGNGWTVDVITHLINSALRGDEDEH